MNQVRCAGCRRRIGWANNSTTGRIWCTTVCMYLPDSTTHEARDDLAFLLYKLGTAPMTKLAAMLNVTYKRVHQIIQSRSTT